MIYCVEDDANIRKLVCYALEKVGYSVLGYEDSTDFWKAINTKLPQLVLIDIMLPGEDGLSILKKLKSNSKTADIPVIILSAKDSEFDKVTGLDLGADDYIAKPFGVTELTARINSVIRRYNKTNSERKDYSIGSFYLNPYKHIITVNGERVDLSLKEYTLLLELLEADGDVISRDKLLTRVWGEYYTESRTLDVHISKLRVKLGEMGYIIETVKGIGYKIGTTNGF